MQANAADGTLRASTLEAAMHRLLAPLAALLAACATPPAPEMVAAPAERPAAAVVGKADQASATAAGPWGGADPARWTPEAVLANAAEEALADPAVVVVAFPVRLSASDVAPFGDGQTNAVVDLPGWSVPRPPVVAALRHDGAVTLRLDHALGPIAGLSLQVEDGAPLHLALAPDAAGHASATWQPPAGWRPATDRLILRPDGWNDAFPLSFRHPVRDADVLADSVPAPLRPAALPDPAGVSGRPGSAADALAAQGAGPGYNHAPYVTPTVHAGLPGRVTAVGGARSWVTEAPFKHVYLCLDGRDAAAEAATGAPSGAGWHAIGDPAESLVNSLEAVPLLAAWGQAHLFADDEHGFAFGAGAAAYGLTDVATFRHLQPGEALVTGRDSDYGPPVFHWYAAAAAPACVEIWVHPCGLDADETFACRPAAVQLQVRGAHTVAGEAIFLVGDHPALGAWDAAQAVPLDPAGYPTWLAELRLPPGETLHFKPIRRDAAGRVTWSGGADHTWTVPYAARAFHGVDWVD